MVKTMRKNKSEQAKMDLKLKDKLNWMFEVLMECDKGKNNWKWHAGSDLSNIQR